MVDQTIPGIRSGEQADWIEHDGGGRPNSPLTYVEAKTREGRIFQNISAMILWPWEEGNGSDADDIIAWREIPEPPNQVELARREGHREGLMEGARTLWKAADDYLSLADSSRKVVEANAYKSAAAILHSWGNGLEIQANNPSPTPSSEVRHG